MRERFYRFRFVTKPDGRTAFFPLGELSVFAGGYVISSAEVTRLRRLLAIYWYSSIGWAILAVLLIDAALVESLRILYFSDAVEIRRRLQLPASYASEANLRRQRRRQRAVASLGEELQCC